MRQRALLNQAGNRYAGSGDFTYDDLGGAVVATGNFTITATRITVEAPR